MGINEPTVRIQIISVFLFTSTGHIYLDHKFRHVVRKLSDHGVPAIHPLSATVLTLDRSTTSYPLSQEKKNSNPHSTQRNSSVNGT